MKKLLFTWTVSACVLCGCTFNSSYQNRENDKKEAEKVTNNFYALLELKQFNQVEKLFSDTFFSIVGQDGLSQVIKRSNEEFGSVVRDSLIEWETRVITGTNSRSDYTLRYDVSRTKKNTIETFSLRGEAKGIKIVGYNVSYSLSIEPEKSQNDDK
jgi:hypothetical protein